MEMDEATRQRIIEQKRKMMNDIHEGHYGLVAMTINSKWTWRAVVFAGALFAGNFLAQAIFEAGIEYGRNSCGVTTLYKSK